MNILTTPGVNILERDSNRPVISGRLPSEIGKGGEMEIVIGADRYTVMIDPADGSWSWTPPEDLADGTYSLSIRATDSAGNEGTPKLYNLVISTTPPEPPELIQLYDDVGGKTGSFDAGVPTDDRRPTLTGLAPKGSIVFLKDGDVVIGSALADAETGKWTLEPNVDLQEGENSLTLITRDTFAKKERESEESEPFTIVVGADGGENGGGGIALITYGWDDSGENVGELSSGALTSDTTPQLFGSAPVNGTVRIQYRSENGRWTDGGTVTAGADGEWNWTAPELAAGSWEFRSSAAASGGWSDEFALEISGQAQGAVTITHGWDSEGAYTGELRSGALTDDNKPQLFGRAEANSLVYVHTRLQNGEWERVGSAYAGPDGRWTLETERLSAGHNQLMAGNSPAAQGGDIFDLEVMTADPAAPQIVDIYDDVGPITGYMGNPDVTDDRTPRLEGRAPTGAVVVIYQDGAPVGSVVAAGGVWQYEVPALTEDKTYSFTSAIRSGGVDGPQSAPWDVELNTRGLVDVTLEIISMTADSGASATDFITNDGSAGRTVSGTLSRELAQGERVLVSNGTQTLEAVVSGLTWTLIDSDAHNDSWEYTAWVENGISGENSERTVQKVTFDGTISGATIDSIYDSANSEDLDSGDSTTDRTPTLSGKAEAGSLVTIYDGNVPVGSSFANNSGHWTWTPDKALVAKKYIFSIGAEDAAGNQTIPSSQWEINILVTVRNTENWESTQDFKYILNKTYYHSSGLKSRVISGSSRDLPGIVKTVREDYAAGSKTLLLSKNSTIEFTLEPTNTFSISTVGTDGGDVIVRYYGANNELLKTDNINTKNAGHTEWLTSVYTSNDPLIEKITVFTNDGGGIYLDRLSWGGEVNTNTGLNEKNSPEENDLINALNGVDTAAENKGQIDLTGDENNQVSLNLNDLLTSGEKNLFIENGKTQLLISGDENDTVQLDDLLPDGTDSGDWVAQNGTVTVAGIEYQVFSHSGEEAEVLIQQGIKTELI